MLTTGLGARQPGDGRFGGPGRRILTLATARARLIGCRPANLDDIRLWLSISLESHIIGDRLHPAVRMANQLLRVDPDNEKANAFLARVRQTLESLRTAPQAPTN
ncbi:MAG: hypothetical protein QGH25_05530 [Candidatus Latescibacteria bacterium]|jgi:hypothetical protein|nr:hypothetical protein [Candidatus Latescibacterota bacterium]